jgi:2-polyprenyl-3-methyl-5-hydroxy-6-metoxy-1,4-benzoquinol methylase
MSKKVATPEDVYHAYRLLLGREPDSGGYAHYCSLVEAQALSPMELTWRFMESPEFRENQGILTMPDSGTKPEVGTISLKSEACTQRRVQSSAFRYWATCLREKPGRLHRKLWEWCYISQALHERGMLCDGQRGLGFAVGNEPLSSLFANLDCRITASDVDQENAGRAGWIDTNQHATSANGLNSRSICPDDAFSARVRFREVDMRAIPDDLTGFDFLWSACALEHLGSLENGIEFVLRAIRCLKPGGIAVHTTELNCDSDEDTVATGHSVIYRKRDLLALAKRVRAEGHTIEPYDFDLGDDEWDRYVDEPPYHGKAHLKLRLDSYVSTSFGLIIRKLDRGAE